MCICYWRDRFYRLCHRPRAFRCWSRGLRPDRSDKSTATLTAAGAEVHRGALDDLDSLRSGSTASDGVIHYSFPQRQPILFSLVLLVVVLIIYVFAGTITYAFKLPTLAIYVIGNSLLALIAVVLLSRLHWWRESGFHLPSKPRSLWFFIVPCLPVFLNIAFAGIGDPGIARLLLFFALALSVGFVEEAYFRGMMLRALLPRGPWQAVITSSILFGILHLFNLASGANLGATLLQIVYALAIGLMYAALRVRTQTILPLIFLHGVIRQSLCPRQ